MADICKDCGKKLNGFNSSVYYNKSNGTLCNDCAKQENEKNEKILKQLKEIDSKREVDLALGQKQTKEDIKRKELISTLEKKSASTTLKPATGALILGGLCFLLSLTLFNSGSKAYEQGKILAPTLGALLTKPLIYMGLIFVMVSIVLFVKGKFEKKNIVK
ncbi:MAG: hypothetical protein WC852_02590 [Candidatus Nanoarchaeia archaeon]|jgi:hypothetical protein